MIHALLASTDGQGLVSDTMSAFVALLGFAATVGVLTKFVKIPYTVALVLAGLAVALLDAAPPDWALNEELVLVLFLPPLLFQAGLHMNLAHLQRKAIPVAALAIPGVLLSMLAVAFAVRFFIPDEITQVYGPWLPALLFGAMLAPTDPISVLAVFKSANAPERLKTLVEGESLFNDGTGVVLFLILRAAIIGVAAGSIGEPAATETLSIASGVIEFVRVVGFGLVAGLGCGMIAFWLLKRLDDHVLENAITVVLVWGSFIIAEKIHGSGVIAVVVAGLIMGNYGSKLAMSKRTCETIETFWESIDFIVNSLVFLLIGIELQFIGGANGAGVQKLVELNVLLAIACSFVAILASRAVMVYTVALMFGKHWPRGWKHIVWWAGLKGSIPIALVLGLPDTNLREFLLPVAFGIVLISLLLQGLTMPTLIRKSDVGPIEDEPEPKH